jgi:hypothetical protein
MTERHWEGGVKQRLCLQTRLSTAQAFHSRSPPVNKPPNHPPRQALNNTRELKAQHDVGTTRTGNQLSATDLVEQAIARAGGAAPAAAPAPAAPAAAPRPASPAPAPVAASVTGNGSRPSSPTPQWATKVGNVSQLTSGASFKQ